MKKTVLINYKFQNRPKAFSQHITNYLKEQGRLEQLKTCRKVNSWVHQLIGKNIPKGTAVGKHYATLILDLDYNDAIISVGETGISIRGKEVNTYKEFKAAVQEIYTIEKYNKE